MCVHPPAYGRIISAHIIHVSASANVCTVNIPPDCRSKGVHILHKQWGQDKQHPNPVWFDKSMPRTRSMTHFIRAKKASRPCDWNQPRAERFNDNSKTNNFALLHMFEIW